MQDLQHIPQQPLGRVGHGGLDQLPRDFLPPRRTTAEEPFGIALSAPAFSAVEGNYVAQVGSAPLFWAQRKRPIGRKA
jgi:hypothetical protein